MPGVGRRGGGVQLPRWAPRVRKLAKKKVWPALAEFSSGPSRKDPGSICALEQWLQRDKAAEPQRASQLTTWSRKVDVCLAGLQGQPASSS